MSKVTELSDQDFRTTLEKTTLAFVDFHADWCGPCRLFSPVFSKVAERHADAEFFKIDGDLNPDSRAEITIDNLPYVACYKHGKFIEGFSTTVEAGLETFIARMKETA